ncbi:MBL fold metallo-hydrolase [Virgibacillus halophilus]|uniref:MBL fold metallo-hydrolase n=1 Tax=Tigheibacillus halophilus TaxID=361280 RepID=UPI00363D99E4
MLNEIAKNIYKMVITFPGGMGAVNAYLVKGKQGYTVVDTGMYSNESIGIWKRLLDTGISVEKVVLTHTHQDHIGLAKWFQQDFSVPVFVSEPGVAEMQKYCGQSTVKKLIRLVAQHGGPRVSPEMGEDSFIYDFQPDGTFHNNEQIQLGDDLYETIWTPGHAPDHFCFYNRQEKIMLIGDHILKNISPVIGLWSGEEGNPLADYLPSLDLIANFPSDIVLPGHGEPVYHLAERSAKLKESHYNRLQGVMDIVSREPKTAYEVCREMYGTIDIILQLSSFMATLTRLLYLEAEGKVARKVDNGVVRFEVTGQGD